MPRKKNNVFSSSSDSSSDESEDDFSSHSRTNDSFSNDYYSDESEDEYTQVSKKKKTPAKKAPTKKAKKKAPTKKAPTKKAKKTNRFTKQPKTYEELAERDKTLGKRLRAEFDKGNYSELDVEDFRPPEMTRDVLNRVYDSENNELVEGFADIWRAAWKGQDELTSTEFVHNLLEGFFESEDGFEDEQLEVIRDLVDLLSSPRLPTASSGLATQSNVMQHPTNYGKAVFGPSPRGHNELDRARREHVGNHLEKALDDGKDVTEAIKIAVRESIAYTLTSFTAPSTAKNVFEHTLLAEEGEDGKEKAKQQVQARDRMKQLYEKLGGELNLSTSPETEQEGLERVWTGENIDPSPIGLNRQPSDYRDQTLKNQSVKKRKRGTEEETPTADVTPQPTDVVPQPLGVNVFKPNTTTTGLSTETEISTGVNPSLTGIQNSALSEDALLEEGTGEEVVELLLI